MSTNGKLTNEAPMLLAALEQAKKELREEFDQDIFVLGNAVFGTTNEQGQLLKPGMVHMFTALDNTLAFLCEKFGVKPEDINKWVMEKAELAKQAPTQVLQ